MFCDIDLWICCPMYDFGSLVCSKTQDYTGRGNVPCIQSSVFTRVVELNSSKFAVGITNKWELKKCYASYRLAWFCVVLRESLGILTHLSKGPGYSEREREDKGRSLMHCPCPHRSFRYYFVLVAIMHVYNFIRWKKSNKLRDDESRNGRSLVYNFLWFNIIIYVCTGLLFFYCLNLRYKLLSVFRVSIG